MIVVMRVQQFDFEGPLPFPVRFEAGKAVGYLPVYKTREDAQADYPNGPFAEVAPTAAPPEDAKGQAG